MIKIKNVGKKFESSIQSCVPEYALMYRLPDSAQSFGGSSKLRFSKKNPFDFLLWDSLRHILYAFELKTVAGKSISFERSKDETGEIHFHQINGLREWSLYDGIISGFIVEFRQIEKTIFIEINDFDSLIEAIDKKSFSYNDIKNLHIPHIEIAQEKMRVNYKYDVASFLNESALLFSKSRKNSAISKHINNE